MGRDALVLLSMRVVGTFFWLGYTVVLARTLSQPDFALVLYVVNFSMIAVLVVTLGRDVALLRLVSQSWKLGAHSAARRMLAKSRRAVFLSSVLLTAALVISSVLGLDTPMTSSPLIALLSGLITMAGAQMGLNRDTLRSLDKVWQSQIGFNFVRTVIPAVGALLVHMSFNMNAKMALVLFLVALGLSIMIEEAILRKVQWVDDPKASAPDSADVMRAGLRLWPGNIANAVQMRIAGLVAGLAFEPETAALFLAAERIANLAQFPIAAAGQAAGPRVAQAALLNLRETQSELSNAGLLMLVGSLIGCIGAATLAWPGLWMLGPDYLAALPMTLILIAAHLSWAIFGFGQDALNLTGNHHIYRNVAVIMAIIGTFTTSLIAIKFGPLAMAWAYCAIWWTTNIVFVLALYATNRLKAGAITAHHAQLRRNFARPSDSKE